MSRRIFDKFSPETITPTLVIEQILSEPSKVISISKYVSELISSGLLEQQVLISVVINALESHREILEQTLFLVFLACLETSPIFFSGTMEYLNRLSMTHNHSETFSKPFMRFISQRLQMISSSETERVYENVEDTEQVLELLLKNKDFFEDITELQNFFSMNVSPIMPLNATWNPELTKIFGVKRAEGLWYVYSHNHRQQYKKVLKEYLTSEWTGFNRFNKEPWDNLRNNVDQNGKLVDLGSSIGITALEIGNAIDFEGEIILVDYYNPYREISSLRVIDYAENTSRLIPFKETLERMEVLRGNKIVHYLFGVDVGVSFSEKVLENISNASLVHVGNVLPYVPSKKLFQTLKNALMITSKNGGVLRVHNDNNLPTGALLQSLTVLRENDNIKVLRQLLK